VSPFDGGRGKFVCALFDERSPVVERLADVRVGHADSAWEESDNPCRAAVLPASGCRDPAVDAVVQDGPDVLGIAEAAAGDQLRERVGRVEAARRLRGTRP
jgi:hypothetical protein